MLDWMKGTEPEAADTSKVLEPPETPAPVFAIRAFKSALFGTPGAEDEKTPHPAQPKQTVQGHQRSKSDTTKPVPIPVPKILEPNKTDLDAIANPSGSPTKSILVTPGTISNRRKTVSFGESVVDNEGKRDSHSTKVVKTPPNPSGNLSIQWMSGSADGKPRSKLTQTLLDARDNATKNADSSKSTDASNADIATRSQSKDESDAEDITLNLDEPRSESGKYWKTEFDNYRVRTNREIKKLIHYRTIAKSYARKKDSEAVRLADKLKEEEEKVSEMERQVTRLASSITGQGSQADNEQLIQDLTKQTTLALQYKQQVTSLRTLLEKQGVLKDGVVQVSEPAKGKESVTSSDELRETQLQLKQANAKIEEMRQQNPDLSALETLAQSSEKKAQELERENKSLKQTLARVKQEMSRYEGRRKEKENKLKQREAKLEARIQEYRDRLKTTTQEHRQSEDALRKSFDDERRRMQTQIDQLRIRVSAVERAPTLRSHYRRSMSPRKEYTGVQAYDFAGQSQIPDHPEVEEEATEDIEAPPSPSPRSKSREARQSRNSTGALELKRTSRDMRDTADDDAVTHYLNEILPRPNLRSRHTEPEINFPSSPPDISTLKSLSRGYSKYKTGENQRSYRSLYRDPRDPDTTNSNTQAYTNSHRPRTHIRSTLDTISGPTTSRAGLYAGNTISSGERLGRGHVLAGMTTKDLPSERVYAAKSRLSQKSERARALGKENL
ncbi:Spindle-body formation-associated protein [Penicillium odoratum]|uniref:Spindle-body formation-associated protein n=1 Tax=Penicillium odoratum TaxID=1167516 RepID=UPI0025486079|nr:Spindle-body formation-associated protein [Penicillium odoratum]KAJ5752059.1 Spindle-body formation-associated protein [Penicillium odoratum]